jgi:hypothetical protein
MHQTAPPSDRHDDALLMSHEGTDASELQGKAHDKAQVGGNNHNASEKEHARSLNHAALTMMIGT